jgi:hypothetical protein
MSKQISQIVRVGQLKGAKLKIKAIKNDGLQEYAAIINLGTVAQPMSGWALASLRGQTFYPFPDDLMFEPGMVVKVQSGQQEPKETNNMQGVWVNLLWTVEQVWNNRGDIAILFDANGVEVDRHSYPHERVMGSGSNRRKVLVRKDDGFEIVNVSLRKAKKGIRKQSGALADPL